MIYKGKVKGDVVIIKKPFNIEEGAEVEIIPVNKNEDIDTICGSWKDKRSAEEIINEIRSSRFSKEKDIDL